jgi:hypothetical protein
MSGKSPYETMVTISKVSHRKRLILFDVPVLLGSPLGRDEVNALGDVPGIVARTVLVMASLRPPPHGTHDSRGHMRL